MKLVPIFSAGFAATLLPIVALAGDSESKAGILSQLGGSVGASWAIGQMSNGEMDLPSRTMNAFSLEALPTYRFKSLLLGAGFDYRWQGQLTSIENAGGTNLKGQAWLVGLGARYFLSDSLALQGNLNFLGTYRFDNKTHAGEDDHLNRPLGLKIKGQYFFTDLPLTADVGLEYLRWSSLTVRSTEFSHATSQWMIGAGLTYHFGKIGKDRSVDASQLNDTVSALPSQTTSTPSPEKKIEEQLVEIAPVIPTERGAMVNMSGDVAFAPYSTELSPQALETVEKIASVLAKNPRLEVRVEGYTDTSGQLEKNRKISQARAESVKRKLIESGVKAENVTATGHGPARPVASNATAEGRSKNRRVEIYVQEPGPEKSAHAQEQKEMN